MLCTRADDLCGNVTLRGHGFHVRILAFMASDSEIPKNRSCKNPLSAECGAWAGTCWATVVTRCGCCTDDKGETVEAEWKDSFVKRFQEFF